MSKTVTNPTLVQDSALLLALEKEVHALAAEWRGYNMMFSSGLPPGASPPWKWDVGKPEKLAKHSLAEIADAVMERWPSKRPGRYTSTVLRSAILAGRADVVACYVKGCNWPQTRKFLTLARERGHKNMLPLFKERVPVVHLDWYIEFCRDSK
jgi:hypothetical protein